MLKPHPTILRKLVEEYEELMAHEGQEREGRPNRRAQDLAYTLCVSTGTRDVRSALEEAYRLLAAAQEPVTRARRPQAAGRGRSTAAGVVPV